MMDSEDAIEVNLSQWRDVAQRARDASQSADGASDPFTTFRWEPSDPDAVESRAAEVERSLAGLEPA